MSKKIDKQLFSSNQEASEAAYGDCPDCGSPLHIKHKGKSSFLGCSSYPDCDYTHSLSSLEVTVLKPIEDSECPKCSSQLAVKKGRYGMFIACLNFPECHFISNKQINKNTSEYSPLKCPSCNDGHLQKKQNKYGKFIFACDNYPSCKTVFNQEPIAKKCANCGSEIMLKQSKSEKLRCPVSTCKNEQTRD